MNLTFPIGSVKMYAEDLGISVHDVRRDTMTALAFAEPPADAQLLAAARRQRLLPGLPTRAVFGADASPTL